MGEGSHFYQINGKHFITSYDSAGYMVGDHADKATGPYDATVSSAEEAPGIGVTGRLRPGPNLPFVLTLPQNNFSSAILLHQGGIVQTPSGEWWGFSMMDHNAVGRLLCLTTSSIPIS